MHTALLTKRDQMPRSVGRVEALADAGDLEDVAAKPPLSELVGGLLDWRQLLEVPDEDDRLLGARSDHPKRWNRRHRRLVEDDGVEGAGLNGVSLVGARQSGRDHGGLRNDKVLDQV